MIIDSIAPLVTTTPLALTFSLLLLQIMPTHDQLQAFRDYGFPVFLVVLPWIYTRLVNSVKKGVHSVMGPELSVVKDAILKELQSHATEDRDQFKEVKLAIGLAQASRITHLESAMLHQKDINVIKDPNDNPRDNPNHNPNDNGVLTL